MNELNFLVFGVPISLDLDCAARHACAAEGMGGMVIAVEVDKPYSRIESVRSGVMTLSCWCRVSSVLRASFGVYTILKVLRSTRMSLMLLSVVSIPTSPLSLKCLQDRGCDIS